MNLKSHGLSSVKEGADSFSGTKTLDDAVGGEAVPLYLQIWTVFG